MVFGFDGKKGDEQSPSKNEGRKPYAPLASFEKIPEALQTALEDIGSSLHQAGCRFGVAADVSVIKQETQEISQDKPQGLLNNIETKTVGIERL